MLRTGHPGLLVQNQESVIMNGLNPPQPPQQPPQQAPNQHHTQQTHQHHGPITDTFSVPDQLVGLIIGKNGEVSSDFCFFFFKPKIIVEPLRFPKISLTRSYRTTLNVCSWKKSSIIF